MKISVAIIAHNEGQHIAHCLSSLTCQTEKPDEIILVAHNCTDDTVKIAKTFSGVRIVELQGTGGIPQARQKSLEEASGDIILCADGDSYYQPTWVSEMIKILQTPGTVGVGGLVWMSGLVGHWMSFDYFYLTPLTRSWRQFYFWGSSMGFYKKDLLGLTPLAQLTELKDSLGLHYLPDDLFLALQFLKKGKIRLARHAVSHSFSKDQNLRAWLARAKYQKLDYDKLLLKVGRS